MAERRRNVTCAECRGFGFWSAELVGGWVGVLRDYIYSWHYIYIPHTLLVSVHVLRQTRDSCVYSAPPSGALSLQW